MPKKEFRKVSKAWSEAVHEAEKLGSTCALEDNKHHTDSTTTTITTAGVAVHEHASNDGRDPTSATTTPGGHMTDNGRQKVGDFLTRRVRELLREKNGEPDAGAIGYLERSQCTNDGCDNLCDLSLSGYGVYEELKGGNVRVPGGYSRIIDALARKVWLGDMRNVRLCGM